MEKSEGDVFGLSLIGPLTAFFVIGTGALVIGGHYAASVLPACIAFHHIGQTLQEYWGWQNEKAKKSKQIIHDFVKAKREFVIAGAHEASALFAAGSIVVGVATKEDDILNIAGGALMLYLTKTKTMEHEDRAEALHYRHRRILRRSCVDVDKFDL